LGTARRKCDGFTSKNAVFIWMEVKHTEWWMNDGEIAVNLSQMAYNSARLMG
jgi:hypothetical protein